MLVAIAKEYDLCILNSVLSLILNDNWTSYQGKTDNDCHSVIDFTLCLARSLSLVKSFNIEPWSFWSDHVPLVLELLLPGVSSDGSLQSQQLLHEHPLILPTDLPLDRMLIDTIQYYPSTDEALTKLYGLVFFSSPLLIHAYSDSACFHNGTPHAHAGAGIYFGPNSALNDSFKVTSPQTNNRGELLVILKILVVAWRDHALHILTDSEYSIYSIVYWGPAHAAQGWHCSNGDLLSDIAAWIYYCTAPLILKHIDAHSGNAHNDVADALAKAGTNMEIEN